MHQTLNDKYALKYTNFQEISARLVLNSDVDTAMANVQRDLTVEKQHCVWL